MEEKRNYTHEEWDEFYDEPYVCVPLARGRAHLLSRSSPFTSPVRPFLRGWTESRTSAVKAVYGRSEGLEQHKRRWFYGQTKRRFYI